MKVPIDVQIAEIKRELMMRETAYPKMVSEGKIESGIANLRQRDMAAVLKTLEWVRDNREAVLLAYEITTNSNLNDFMQKVRAEFPEVKVSVKENYDD